MNQVRKFVPRAFRYVLRPQDKDTMRFSLEHAHGPNPIEQTHLMNLSESGVAFLVSPNTSIHLNDHIKVEVPIPSGDQFAWWGRVVRVEEYEPRSWMFGKDPFHEDPKIMVAVKFEQLPEAFSKAIRKGIEKSFMQAMRDQQYRNWLYYRTLAMQRMGQIILYACLIAFTVGFIYYFTRPSANYDPKTGTPWGDRYRIWPQTK